MPAENIDFIGRQAKYRRVRMTNLSTPFFMNPFLQMSHEKFFLSEWVIRCCFKLYLRLKNFEQISHTKIFSELSVFRFLLDEILKKKDSLSKRPSFLQFVLVELLLSLFRTLLVTFYPFPFFVVTRSRK